VRRHPQARFFAVDEARFGLKTWFRRRWCPVGVRPPWVFQDRYEWVWLYAAVEPRTGESFCLYMPQLNGDCFEVFLREMRRAYPDDEIVLVSDRAGSHTSGRIVWPAGITSLLLPACSPELDPVERWFGALRGPLSNVVFESIEELAERLTVALRPYWEQPARLARLTGYGWWTQATGSILTSPH
jgi:transposase